MSKITFTRNHYLLIILCAVVIGCMIASVGLGKDTELGGVFNPVVSVSAGVVSFVVFLIIDWLVPSVKGIIVILLVMANIFFGLFLRELV